MLNNKKKIIVYISIVAMFVLATLYSLLYTSYKNGETEYKKNAQDHILIMQNDIEKDLLLEISQIEYIPKNIALFLKHSPPTRQNMQKILEQIMHENEFISGICVFNVTKTTGKPDKLDELYYYRDNDSIAFTTLTVPDDTLADWFVLPKQAKHGVWIEPYSYILSDTTKTAKMISYTIPYYKNDSVFGGVVDIDLFLTYMNRFMQNTKVLKNGSAFLLSENKKIISAQDTALHALCLDTLAGLLNQPVFETLSKKLDSGKDGVLPATNIFKNKNAMVAFKHMPNNMILCLILPADELYAEFNIFKEKILIRAISALIFVICLAIAFYYFFTNRFVSYYNKSLEKQVLLQTRELQEKNEELTASDEELRQNNEELLTLNENITKQKNLVEKAHRDIKASITYAKTIQDSLFPSQELLELYLHDYFLIYRPKDVVGGDFYYVNKIENNLIVAVADCTGHGVPGGFMTVLGITYLHDVIKENVNLSAGDVLNRLRDELKKTFHRFGNENMNGLDIALCIINTQTNILQYAGAYNPLFIVRDNELKIFTATKNPIGFFLKESDFVTTDIPLVKNDLIYLFSDGFSDQFGGDAGRKFTMKRFKDLLLTNSGKSIAEQHRVIENTLDNWQNNSPQIDDITVLGLRVKS